MKSVVSEMIAQQRAEGIRRDFLSEYEDVYEFRLPAASRTIDWDSVELIRQETNAIRNAPQQAGSSVYLALLDSLFTPFKADEWGDLDAAWNALGGDPHEIDLICLAEEAFSQIADTEGSTLDAVLQRARDLHIAKNAGYAGADNPDPWANFRLSTQFGVTPLKGVYVRMSDKYIRIQNLRKDPSNERVGESILDTLRDLAAYALIAVCLMRESENYYLDY